MNRHEPNGRLGWVPGSTGGLTPAARPTPLLRIDRLIANVALVIALAMLTSTTASADDRSTSDAGRMIRTVRYAVTEVKLIQRDDFQNNYRDALATATLRSPSGHEHKVPLFWDGSNVWRFRTSLTELGIWTWSVSSNDYGMDDAIGKIWVKPSELHGGIRPMTGHPYHFENEDQTPFWFCGDTGWALFTDNAAEQHDREAALQLIDTRSAQGFNVMHCMLISEAAWGNAGGAPFTDLSNEQINPKYWQEVDARLSHLNQRGMTAGLVLAWGDKGRNDPWVWRRFASQAARRRYARYVAARYSAFNVYFIVAGEWNADIRSTPQATEAMVREDYNDIGNTLRDSDPHGRMIAIHPMTSAGSAREFTSTNWMSFGDYQQNYHELHQRVLLSRTADRPVVNAEYAYYLRDREGDGKVDKENSANIDMIRHATWDIAMAGGYFVSGFGTTYFGGNRHPGPFRLAAAENEVWERQVQHVKSLFSDLRWWMLQPSDNLVSAMEARSPDLRSGGIVAPPQVAYWALAEPGQQYLLYVRGCKQEVRLSLGDARHSGRYRLREFNPRSGTWKTLEAREISGELRYQPPAEDDWIVLLTSASVPSGDSSDTRSPAENFQSPTNATYFPPPESAGGWRKLDLAADIQQVGGMNAAKLTELRDWLLNSDDRDFAAVVIRKGHVVLEVERGNSAQTDARRVASVSKAVCATVLAIASEQSQQGRTPRKMKFDDPAFDFIPWAQPLGDPRKARITVKQLLNHTSGICPEALGARNDGSWEYVLGYSGDERTARLAFEPGTNCGYSTHALCHAALVCETVTGKPYDQFAIEALFKPIGCEHWWFQFYDGEPKIGRHPSHGLGMPARDLARIAYCLLRDGRWNDKQIVPAWFVRETAAPTHDLHVPEMRLKRNSETFSHGWELPARSGVEAAKGIPADARFKPGSGGQLIAFIPSLDLVVTRQTGSSGSWEYEEYLRRACLAVTAK